MRKAFSKSLVPCMFLALVLSSGSVGAAYSSDADCAAVSNGAAAGGAARQAAIDAAAAVVGGATENAKSCVDRMVDFSIRNILDFGGGQTIPTAILQSLASFGCKVLSSAQTTVQNQINGLVNQAPGAVQPAVAAAVQSGGAAVANAAIPAWQVAFPNLANREAAAASVSPAAPATPATPATPADQGLSIFQRIANIF